MKKYIFDKEYLKYYSLLEIGLENLEEYFMPVSLILDMYFEVEETKNYLHVKKGYLKLSKAVTNIHSDCYEEEYDEESKFINRIPKYLDIVNLYFVNVTLNKRLCLFVEHDPVIDPNNQIIEFRNCASFEFDEKDNIILKFGELSNTPKIENEPSHQIIKNYKEVIGEEDIYFADNEVLDFEKIDNNGSNNIKLTLSVKVKKRRRKVKKIVELLFEDVYDLEYGGMACEEYEYIYYIEINNLLSKDYFAVLYDYCWFKFKKCSIRNIEA